MTTGYKYDTFNARYLSFEEVANTFMPNKVFDQLISNNHTLLMGPRGCGKTTLLKMLTPKALHSFNRKHEKEKILLPFIGIYIPSDKQWEKQIKSFEKRFEAETKFSLIVSKEIVNTNILISLFNTFNDLTENNERDGSLKKEAEFCTSIVDTIQLERPISPNFFSIIKALKHRISDINFIVNKVDLEVLSIEDVQWPTYFFRNFLDQVTTCCLEFEKTYGEKFTEEELPKRWALCFDELEIAPEWLQKELITNHLRSRDQNFLFKLTTTPLVDAKYWLKEHSTPLGPSQNEDYKVIRNWVFDAETGENWKQFGDALFTSLFNRDLGLKLHLNEIFGKTHDNVDKALIEDPIHKTFEVVSKTPYAKGSVEWNIFKLLAEKDHSFYDFLSRKSVVPFDPQPTSQIIKDTVLRKIKPIAYFRYYFTRGIGLRSRKVVDLYSGIPLIFEICDGNPRTLLNLFDSFKNRVRKDKKDLRNLAVSEQARIIKNVCELKLENIKNHPDANISLDKNLKLNLGELLEEIGNYFFNSLIKEPFTMDPIGTFVIDRNLDDRVAVLLKFGLNIGAIQYINPSQDISDEDVYNKQYRLSFSLFPCFNLPIREYGSVQLSRILPKYAKERRRPRLNRGNDLNHPELFSNE